ncbi:hypothetical protein AB6A40_000588 [Gnathostoma spinigerum]|uniref:Uncharacterized protein n=1 Tax=Gnathostoma spinigerum TaxID=75299 RepID=A0ABD6E934_9BILA
MSVDNKASPGITNKKQMLLTELRVFELKQELEKRGLDKNGIKFALIERLEASLVKEGHDPKTYQFSVSDYNKPQTPSMDNSSTNKPGETNPSEDEKVVSENITKSEDFAEKADDTQKQEDTKEANRYMECDAENTVQKDDEETVDVKNEGGDMELDHVEKEEDEGITLEDDDLEDIEKSKSGGRTAGMTEVANKEEDTSNKVDSNGDEGTQETAELKTESVNTSSKVNEESELKTEQISLGAPAETVESGLPQSHGLSESQRSSQSSTGKDDNSLWVKGISPTTKAADLKLLFLKYGRVVTAKIFTRRQQPSTACFGFVTMPDSATADLCIHKLHRTTLKGRIITVERADRCNMPVVKTAKKTTSSGAATKTHSSATATGDNAKSGVMSNKAVSGGDKSEKRDSLNTQKALNEKGKTQGESGDKLSKSGRTSSGTKKTPVKAPSDEPHGSSKGSSKSLVTSSSMRSHRAGPSQMSRSYRGGRKAIAERAGRMAVIRRSRGGIRKLNSYGGIRPSVLGRRSVVASSRGVPSSSSRHSLSHRVEIARRIDPPGWDKREMMEIMRRKEEEHRIKEQELRLQRERERLKFERERIERERLELQQLRQMATFVAPPVPPMVPQTSSRRSHEIYDDVDSSRSRRSDYGRSTSDRPSSSHRSITSSSRNPMSDRRESRTPTVSSHHVSSSHHGSSRSGTLERDRSRHGSREYGSMSLPSDVPSPMVDRDSRSSLYGRADDYSRRSGSGYARDSYKGSSSSYNGSHRGETGYSGRALSYSSSSAGYVGSSREYDMGGGSSWSSSVGAQSHGMSASWPRSGESWPNGNSTYNSQSVGSYDKYDAYDKYGSRRY